MIHGSVFACINQKPEPYAEVNGADENRFEFLLV